MALVNTEARWAWIAGVIEGDGCFTIVGSVTYPAARVSIAMTDKDVLDRVCAWAGVGKVTGPRYNRKGHNILPMWYWHVGAANEVRFVIEKVSPWLGERRAARAKELLAVIDAMPGGNASKVKCKHGHPLIGSNLYVWNGHRECKTCRAATLRRLRARRKAA